MSQVPITNNSASPMYMGGYMILPGETRHIEDHHVPSHLRAEEAPAAPKPAPNPILELLDKSVPLVVEAFTARDDLGQPLLADDDLVKLKTAEESGKARKGLMAAIAEEELKRANERQSGDPEMDKFAEALKAMSEDELFAQFDLVKENPAATAAIEAEFNRRQGS